MSIHTLTLDEFMRLDAPEHQEALAQYNRAIDEVATALPGTQHDPAARQQQLDRLCRLATLRKVHQGALAELADEPTAPSRPVSQQYFDNELDQLPA